MRSFSLTLITHTTIANNKQLTNNSTTTTTAAAATTPPAHFFHLIPDQLILSWVTRVVTRYLVVDGLQDRLSSVDHSLGHSSPHRRGCSEHSDSRSVCAATSRPRHRDSLRAAPSVRLPATLPAQVRCEGCPSRAMATSSRPATPCSRPCSLTSR